MSDNMDETLHIQNKIWKLKYKCHFLKMLKYKEKIELEIAMLNNKLTKYSIKW